MSEQLEWRSLIPETPTKDLEKKLRPLAHRALWLIFTDFAQFTGAEVARTIANPESDAAVRLQVQKFISPPIKGTAYEGLFPEESDEASDMLAIAKVGPWLLGDAKPFGWKHRLHTWKEFNTVVPERRTRGIHVFSYQEATAEVALRLLLMKKQVAPPEVNLHVPVLVQDEELQAALGQYDASEGPIGERQLSDTYTATCQLRTIPPRLSLNA